MKTLGGITVTSSATLGAIVQFELTYTKDASATVPLFLQVDRVAVHDSPGFDGNSEDLLTGGGCLPSPNGIFDLSAPFTVTDVGTLNPETNTTVIATSGVFEIAVFDSSNELHFEFVFENDRCYSTTEDECFDPVAFCIPPGAGRRKRSATDDTNNSTLQFTVAVNVGRLSNQEGEEVSETECEAMTSFWVVSIVLGVLLLVVLVFAVMLFYRLKTEQGKKQVDREMFGTKNPTF